METLFYVIFQIKTNIYECLSVQNCTLMNVFSENSDVFTVLSLKNYWEDDKTRSKDEPVYFRSRPIKAEERILTDSN